ncbi:hypothetical protein RIF29_14064 [Crotalaria pallida]|uniref:Uncharacterized protein n=1 Tax=Crotalaria pallida TaxID=3830 RepID=A0AAN9FJD3_CROPI
MPKSENEILCLSWITLAMQSLCEIHCDIKTLIANLELPVGDWDEKWIDLYLDISVKLLGICIAFSFELSRLNQGNLILQCALHSLDSASSKQFVQATSSLDGWRKHIGSKNPRIDKCGTILDNLLSDLDVADTYPWAPAFKSLQNLVNEEIRLRFSSGRLPIFKELKAVDTFVKELHPTIKDVVDIFEAESLTKSVKDLARATEKLSQGLDLLAKEVDGFFQVVLSGRDSWLSYLRSDGIVNDCSMGNDIEAQTLSLSLFLLSVHSLSLALSLPSPTLGISLPKVCFLFLDLFFFLGSVFFLLFPFSICSFEF